MNVFKYTLLFGVVLFVIGCKKTDSNPIEDDNPIPPPYGTGSCLFNGERAFFRGHIFDTANGQFINNYRITYDQGLVVDSDTATNFDYLISASEGYFYDGCSFVVTIPETLKIDLVDFNGNLFNLWLLKDSLILSDTIEMNFEI